MLAQPLSAAATDGKGSPVPGAIVKFRVIRGGETGTTVMDTIAVAGFDGRASVGLRLGTALDTSIVEASLSDQPTVAARFRATATPPPRLDEVVPASFSAGDTVRLRGQFFNLTTDANWAFFGSAKGRVVRGDVDTSLTVVVPPCVSAGAVNTRVVVGSVATNAIATTFVGSGGLLTLQPLEGITVGGADLGSCLQLAGGGASYLLVPQSAASNGTRQLSFALVAEAPTLGSEATSFLPLAGLRPEPVALANQFDLALREREARLVDDARASGALRAQPSVLTAQAEVAPPALGSQRSFLVLSKFDGMSFKRITARVRYAGNHIILYVDQDQPTGAFSDDELRTFGDLFDRTLYDLDVRAFGSESDIDGNGRVIFLLTPVVNALTSAANCSAQGFITGFHYGLDLLPTQPNSNRGEIFYALVPDVAGSRSCPHSKEDVERLVPATFVHEFQHMISFGQHVLARGGPGETLWLNEGLSHIAEELAGKTYEAKFPPPLGRTDPDQLFPDSAQGYVTPNMRNAQSFLNTPGATSMDALSGNGTLAERGGSWLFLRWLGDQKGESIYGKLVQTSRTGVANVEDKANETFANLFGDFATAVYTDSLPGVPRASVPPRLRLTSRNLRQIFKRFSDLDRTGQTPVFPFTPAGIVAGGRATGTVTPGSMTYYQLTTSPNEPSVGLRFGRAADLSPFATDDAMQIGIFRLP
ncbi:MAG TPA: hypothetical protein VFW03_06735 [Gemmatimonadaceae bacterium]|nr:hypothetical protein [Gemmatimonadaceae bacterium]